MHPSWAGAWTSCTNTPPLSVPLLTTTLPPPPFPVLSHGTSRCIHHGQVTSCTNTPSPLTTASLFYNITPSTYHHHDDHWFCIISVTSTGSCSPFSLTTHLKLPPITTIMIFIITITIMITALGVHHLSDQHWELLPATAMFAVRAGSLVQGFMPFPAFPGKYSRVG